MNADRFKDSECWAVGECLLELTLAPHPQGAGQLTHAAAGDSYNTAVYLKRLAPQLAVRYVSALGDDALSGEIRRHMCADGIDDDLVDTVPGGAPGLYTIATDARGERRFVYWRAQSAARSMLAEAHQARLASQLARCAVMLITGISLAILDTHRRAMLLALAARVRADGGWVVLDNNYRAALWDQQTACHWMTLATGVCTHALFSHDDEMALHGAGTPRDALARIRALGANEVVLKLGAAGCLVAEGDRTPVHVPAQPVTVVDTTAAGDSFNAAWLAHRLRGGSNVQAAASGCALAAAVVGQPGAIIAPQAMPVLDVGHGLEVE